MTTPLLRGLWPRIRSTLRTDEWTPFSAVHSVVKQFISPTQATAFLLQEHKRRNGYLKIPDEISGRIAKGRILATVMAISSAKIRGFVEANGHGRTSMIRLLKLPQRYRGSIPISCITIGERVRKDLGDLESLAVSIRDRGMLQPIIVTPEMKLVLGMRRLRAAESLGWETVPVRVLARLTTVLGAMAAERDENICRKDFLPSEAIAIATQLYEMEQKNARDRQRAGGKKAGRGRPQAIGSGNLPEPITSEESPGQTHDKVAKAVGMSGSTYEHAKAIVQAAAEHPEAFGDIVSEMDRTGKVDPAYKEMRRRKSQGATQPLDDTAKAMKAYRNVWKKYRHIKAEPVSSINRAVESAGQE